MIFWTTMWADFFLARKKNKRVKEMKQRHKKISVNKYKPSTVQMFRRYHLEKGYDLINITKMLDMKMGCNGWCNELNEPDEEFHHIQLYYRDDIVANVLGEDIEIMDSDKYAVYYEQYKKQTEGFIIFRKIPVTKDEIEYLKQINRGIV